MKFISTRGNSFYSLDETLLQGIAEDGGLFVPDRLPKFLTDDYKSANTINQIAKIFLEPFFKNSILYKTVDQIIEETFSFPIQITKLPKSNKHDEFLELYHGPTAAFKDFGARFLAACLSKIKDKAVKPLTILVATSGDTGGAVASAFHKKPGIRVVILYPNGRVSERQVKQLTCWGSNVLSLAVDGSFDDCQSIVKKAFTDKVLSKKYNFTSANSINIGRLIPQCIYYAYSSLTHYRKTQRKLSFIIPTGNLGNGLACVMTKDMGLPIDRIIFSVNENRLIPDYLEGHKWEPRSSLTTLASAMDVGNPSNMERLINMHGDNDKLSSVISSFSVSDRKIQRQIKDDFNEFGFATCPHTATATFVYKNLPESIYNNNDWSIVATAHPAKFEDIVEPIIGEKIPIPFALEKILSKQSKYETIKPDINDCINAIDNHWSKS